MFKCAMVTLGCTEPVGFTVKLNRQNLLLSKLNKGIYQLML